MKIEKEGEKIVIIWRGSYGAIMIMAEAMKEVVDFWECYSINIPKNIFGLKVYL